LLGTTVRDGELEAMVHRRVLKDDHLGVGEHLNETQCGCTDCGCPGKAVQVDPMKPNLKPPETKHLNLKCDVELLLSKLAFKFNLLRYTRV